jgi:hypothetical protein
MAPLESSRASHHPNLRRRPHAPNKGRGRLQRAIARAFLVAGSDTLSSTAVYDWCFVRDRHRPPEWHRYSVFRILQEIAYQVERVPPHGAWLWRLRDSQSPIKK